MGPYLLLIPLIGIIAAVLFVEHQMLLLVNQRLPSREHFRFYPRLNPLKLANAYERLYPSGKLTVWHFGLWVAFFMYSFIGEIAVGYLERK